MDRQQGLESNAWHRRRNKRIRCDGTRCDFTVPEDEGLTYSTRLHMMQSHKRKCKLRMHPNRLPYTQAYLFDADDGSLRREDSPDDTGSANTETMTGRGSELPDIRMDDEDPEMQFHSDRDIDSGCESLHANLTQDAEMYLRPMEPVRCGEEGEEQVEYILGPYAKHFTALLNQKTLRERLQDRDDEMSKFVRNDTIKNDQEVFIQKHGISVRHATDLKSIETKLLQIAIRMTQRQVSQLTKHSFTMLKRYPLNHEASRIDAVYAALQSKLNIASSHVLKRATKLLFIFRSSKRMSSLLGNPSIKPVETYVEYGRGIRLRRNTLRRNVKQTIRFRESMDIVMRSAAAIIDEYGLEPFVIDLFKTRDREIVMHPQDGNLCISAARRIEFEVNRKHGPDPPQVVILPIQIFADESHMTQNGRHTVTPLKIRIVHRRLFDTHSSRIPQVVAYLPPVDTRSIARAFGEETSIRIDPKLAKRELESSMYHAIMNKAFHHLMIANKFGVPVLWNHRRLLLFPIAYKLSMDMPMISKCSFTKASFVSGSRARTMPCHQCMVIAPEATTRAVEAGPKSDASKAEEFWITRIPLQYRCEKQVEPFITQNLSAWGTLQRKEQSLHFLGDSAAIGWNRFDDADDVAFNATISAFKHKIHLRNRGRFQLTGIDGLHGFLAFWLRGITVAGLKALLSKPNTVHEVGLVAERLTEAQQRATRHLNEVEHSDFPRMWASLDFDEQRHGSASEDTSGDDSESHDEYSSDDEIVRANERNSSQTNTRQRPKAKTKTNDSHINPRRAESNRKGSVSDQLRGIIDSAAGKAWNQIATKITDEARFRRPATYSPIRLSSFLSDLPKFAEQSYSLGFLLQMIVLVHQEHLLSDRTRESFTELATRCIRLYGVLYKEKLRRPWLELIPRLTSDLQSRLDLYKRQINLRWNAPKIHALSHFGDNLTDLGPIKFWDTTDGEKSFQIGKAWFKSLVSADTNIPHNVMLQRAEVFEIGSSSSYWFDKLTRNKDSNAIAYTHEQVSDKAYTHTRESDAARAWYRHRSSSVNCSSILFGIWQNACTTLTYSSESGFEAAPSWRPTAWNPSISFESADDEETNMLWLHTDTALKTTVRDSSDGDRRIGAAAEQSPDQDTQVNIETNREDIRLVSAGVADTSITTALASIDLSGFSFEKRLAIEDLQEFVTMFRQYNGVALMTQMVRRLPFSSIMNAGILAREEFVSFLMNTEVPGFRATDPRVSTEEKFRRIYDNARSTSIDQGSTVRADEPSPSNHRTGSRDGEVSGMAAISLLTSSNPATGRTLAQSAADMSKLVRSDMIFHMDEFVDKVSYRAWKEELALSFVRAEVAAEHRPLLVGLTLGGAIKEHYQQNARYDAPISDVFAILDNKVFSGEYNEHMMHNFETTKFSDLVVRMRGARTKAILYNLYHRVLKYAQNWLPDEYLGDKRLLRALRNAV
ncbi:hypothetical protein FVE85_4214 [Porphyridium purpureum]|uniref:Uncharacterized protein n=1 Tax=Porphyridium purpureum TaxID=35688 RepID=A0A5J4YS63_PORPP|nr:hypothetical protein FVE85_4214 [Porphyridium purpureum]|eukprot:POR2847..scf229_5